MNPFNPTIRLNLSQLSDTNRLEIAVELILYQFPFSVSDEGGVEEGYGGLDK